MPKTFDFQSLHIFLKFSCFLGRSLGLELGTYFLAAHSFLFISFSQRTELYSAWSTHCLGYPTYPELICLQQAREICS